jgi:hypothetical protein
VWKGVVWAIVMMYISSVSAFFIVVGSRLAMKYGKKRLLNGTKSF